MTPVSKSVNDLKFKIRRVFVTAQPLYLIQLQCFLIA